MSKFVHTKSYTGSKFSGINLKPLCTEGTVVVHPHCCFFSAVSVGATVELQIQNRIFDNFGGV